MTKTIFVVFGWCCALPAFGQMPNLAIRTVLYTDTRIGEVMVNDLTGDGRPDLVIPTTSGYVIRINTGSGKFAPAASPVPYNRSDGNLLGFSQVLGDFNRDGRLDIAAVTNLGIYLYKGDGKGGFGPGTRTSITANVRSVTATSADFNGDGIPDIATNPAGGGIQLFLGTGSGDFRERAEPLAGQPGAFVPVMQAQDINGDGIADLISTDPTSQTVTLFLNDGTGGFRVAQTIRFDGLAKPQALTVGDFDRDGKADLAILLLRPVLRPNSISFENPVELWTQDTTGTFSKARSLADGVSLGGLATADVNGDGNVDLIGGSGAETKVFLGDGTGNVGTPITVAAGGGGVSGVDLDGDGKAEILVAGSNAVAVLGTGLAASRVTLERNLNPFTFRISEVFTAVVETEARAAGFPTGTVTLYDGSQPVATATLFNGLAHFVTPFIPGKHVFHAEYEGDPQYGPGRADLPVTESGPPAMVSGSALNTFQALVLDAGGNPVSGAGVIFLAPSSGPSVTFSGSGMALAITGPDGTASSPTFKSNGIPGFYFIGLTVSGYSGVTGTITGRN